MRPCPRRAVAMDRELRTFAEIDPCLGCGGAFFDPGQVRRWGGPAGPLRPHYG